MFRYRLQRKSHALGARAQSNAAIRVPAVGVEVAEPRARTVEMGRRVRRPRSPIYFFAMLAMYPT